MWVRGHKSYYRYIKGKINKKENLMKTSILERQTPNQTKAAIKGSKSLLLEQKY